MIPACSFRSEFRIEITRNSRGAPVAVRVLEMKEDSTYREIDSFIVRSDGEASIRIHNSLVTIKREKDVIL